MKQVSAKSQFGSNLFLVKKEDGRQQACHQIEESKLVHPPLPFQNEKPAIIEGHPQAERVHVQIGNKGSIFLHPTCRGVKEIRKILLRGGPISIPVSMLWTSSSPLRFHQITEDSKCLSSENRHFDHNLS